MISDTPPRNQRGELVCWLALLGVAVACSERLEVLSSRAGGVGAAGGTGGVALPSGGASSGGNAGGAGGEPSSSAVVLSGAAIQLDAGSAHTCAVVDGSLYCWGANPDGALGLGDVSDRDVAVRVGTASDWQAVAVGDSFSCGIRADEVWCFGSGNSGQLGHGFFTSSLVPVQVALPTGARDIVVGDEHACAVLVDDRLFCWGANVEGQLAQDDPYPEPGVNSPSPVQVGASSWFGAGAGQGHGCGIETAGTLHCWGRNTDGQLGIGSLDPGQIRVPLQVGSDADWISVTAGQNGTCGLRGQRDLYCWGRNAFGRLGVDAGELATAPVVVPGMSMVVDFDTDTFHTCAIDGASRPHCWGRNVEGQLGLADTEDRSSPAVVPQPQGSWTDISTGRFHSCGVMREDGADVLLVACTGQNSGGQLGVGDVARRSVFTPTLMEAVEVE